MIIAYKNIAETPLMVVDRVRQAHNIAPGVKMAYAGRLDPMAQGVMIILVGDECLARRTYELLDKEYEFEILIGIETDTYDVMGIVQNREFKAQNKEFADEVAAQLASSVGTVDQAYPPYSAARVNGHPLYWWARAGRIDEIDIPTHIVHIYSAQVMSQRLVDADEVYEYVSDRIARVASTGAFRQPAILDSWKAWRKSQPKSIRFPIISCRIVCSSGTYIRSICHEIGRELGVGALAYSITRTRVGPHIVPITQ